MLETNTDRAHSGLQHGCLIMPGFFFGLRQATHHLRNGLNVTPRQVATMITGQVGFHFIDTQFGVFVRQCLRQFWGRILDDSGVTFQWTIGRTTLCGLIEMTVDLDVSVRCLVRFCDLTFACELGCAHLDRTTVRIKAFQQFPARH